MNIQVHPKRSNLAAAMNSKIRPRAVVGYGNFFLPSPPVTRSPGCILLSLESLRKRTAEDSGRQNDEKMSCKILVTQSRATFFRHSAVLSLPAVLLRELPIRELGNLRNDDG